MRNNNFLQKVILIACGLIIGLYMLFLLLPAILSPILNSHANDVEAIIKDSTGLEAKINGISLTASPKLRLGIKIKNFRLYISDNKKDILNTQNIKVDLKLLPLLIKEVQLGKINADEIYSYIELNKDGIPVFIDYIPKDETEQNETIKTLPYGLVLSNKLPDIKFGKHKIALINSTDNKQYYISGNKFEISNFIFDKKIKIKTNGQIVFDNNVISNYDIKIFNKIMPRLKFDDLIFPKEIVLEENSNISPQNMPTKANAQPQIVITDIFNAINKNKLRADIKADIKTDGTFKEPKQNGYINISKLSVAVAEKQLPDSHFLLNFKGKSTDIDSKIYSSTDKNEATTITGKITSGKNKSIDIYIKSNAYLNNLIRLADSIAQSFGIYDLKTISATGNIDANFNIKSDLKTITSDGHFIINPSTLTYGQYGLKINDIKANIDCSKNNINIKDTGLSILGQPLSIFGTVSSDAIANLKIIADKLSVKGLLGALGQVSILKENDINGGSITAKAILKGSLNDIKPDINVSIDNINIYNKVMDVRLILTNALAKLNIDPQNLAGNIDINSLIVKNSLASASVPKAKIVMDTKDVNIINSYILINNSRIDLTGKIKNYLNENMDINVNATGSLASKDVAAFIPSDFKTFFPYTGSMPVKISVTGNQKVQDISFNLAADKQNYIQFADINLLKGKNTKVHSDIKISNNNAKLSNTGIYANSAQIATINGGINNLNSPKLNLLISIPKAISFPIWGMKHSNITLNGDVSITGTPIEPKIKGKVYCPDISIKDMDFELSNLIADLNGTGISGNATAEKMKFGTLTASNISSKFALNNYTDFYLNNITATAYNGKVSGKISYNIPNFAFIADITGEKLDSTTAFQAISGMSRALTGLLGFDAKISAHGVTDVEIIKTMKGHVNFNINEGRFISLGKLENLFAAQNIAGNALLKTAVAQLTTLSALQETDKFKSITGNLTLTDAKADISSIKVAGPLMSYYVKGTYYILNNTAILNILGRIDTKIVSYLGPLGQLSAEKLLGYIPKFGASTAQLLKQMTSNPESEKTELIPALTNGSSSHKEFKVVFNGNIEKASSVKSFKWLSKCDTFEMDIKKELQNAKEAVILDIENTIKDTQTKAENVKNNVTNIINNSKQQVENTKKSIQQTKEDIKNAKENAKQTFSNLSNMFKGTSSTTEKKQDSQTTNKNSTPATTSTTTQNTSKAATTQKDEKNQTTSQSSNTSTKTQTTSSTSSQSTTAGSDSKESGTTNTTSAPAPTSTTTQTQENTTPAENKAEESVKQTTNDNSTAKTTQKEDVEAQSAE